MIELLIAVLKLVGLVNWADKLIAQREAKKQAQAVAAAPETKQDEINYFDGE